MKNLLVLLLMLISIIYIINPGMGFIELIPDNLPFIGNLDEAGAVALLLMCLNYFGIDLPRIFDKSKKKEEEDENVIEV